MTRQVPMDRALSDEDRAYLHMRGEHGRVEQLDAQFPPGDVEEAEGQAAETLSPPSGPGSAGETAGPDDDYDDWTVQQLQAELVERKLASSGRKPELIARLRANDAESEE